VLQKTEGETTVADAVYCRAGFPKLEMVSKGARHALATEVPGASAPQLSSEIQEEALFR
jgi:hypothetical protein